MGQIIIGKTVRFEQCTNRCLHLYVICVLLVTLIMQVAAVNFSLVIRKCSVIYIGSIIKCRVHYRTFGDWTGLECHQL